MKFKLLCLAEYVLWLLRGKPVKMVKGGWCGCCGKWVEDAEFKFRDYYKIDNFWDLNTICSECIEQSR